MSAVDKVGMRYGKSKSGNKPVISRDITQEFVSVVDGVTFGRILTSRTQIVLGLAAVCFCCAASW